MNKVLIAGLAVLLLASSACCAYGTPVTVAKPCIGSVNGFSCRGCQTLLTKVYLDDSNLRMIKYEQTCETCMGGKTSKVMTMEYVNGTMLPPPMGPDGKPVMARNGDDLCNVGKILATAFVAIAALLSL